MQSVSRQEILAAASQDSRETLERIVDQVYLSLRQMHVSGGTVQDIASLEVWTHRAPAEIEADLAYLEIDRQAVLRSLSEYLENQPLATKRLDWLFLNVLTYAEYIATVAEIRKKLLGVERYVKHLFPPRTEHIVDISLLTKRVWHAPASLGVVAVTFAIHPALSVVAVACLGYASYARKRSARQINAVLNAMLHTYLSFNTVDVSWSAVEAVLERSRESGAIWDASLFSLVAQRRGH